MSMDRHYLSIDSDMKCLYKDKIGRPDRQNMSRQKMSIDRILQA